MPRYECRVGRIETDITTFRILARMSWVATKLYNTALWNARDVWDKTGKIPTGIDLQKTVYESPYHVLLPAHTYQHPAHQVGNGFRSWFALRKSDKTARPPGFRKKEFLSSILFTEDAFRIAHNGVILLTISKGLKDELGYPDKYMPLRILRWGTPLPVGQIKQLEIMPRNGYFEVHAKILLPEPEWRTEGRIVAIDLGMRNPVTSASEDGRTEIYKGGKLLSHLRYWNKERARVQSAIMERPKGRKDWSRSLSRMSKRGARQVGQGIHALTKQIAEDCSSGNVKEVVVGDLGGIKKDKDGKKWNDKSSQNWQQFPIREVVSQLRYKLERSGIRLVEIDERGTSKGRCSACGNEDRNLMRRVHRGLFVCANCGGHINADVNGARNILARYLHQIGKPVEGSSGCLAQPSVRRWNDHLWKVVS